MAVVRAVVFAVGARFALLSAGASTGIVPSERLFSCSCLCGDGRVLKLIAVNSEKYVLQN